MKKETKMVQSDTVQAGIGLRSPAQRGVVAKAQVPTIADILFLTEVAALGDHAFSDNLPQRNYANVKARHHCRYLGLVTYRSMSARRGYWEVTDAGKRLLAATKAAGAIKR